MTFLYTRTNTWSSAPQVKEETINFWKHLVTKSNWRIVQLQNGYYQTEYKDLEGNWIDVTRRETIEGADKDIDGTVAHYNRRLEFDDGHREGKKIE